jgi:hypothetical protein
MTADQIDIAAGLICWGKFRRGERAPGRVRRIEVRPVWAR